LLLCYLLAEQLCLTDRIFTLLFESGFSCAGLLKGIVYVLGSFTFIFTLLLSETVSCSGIFKCRLCHCTVFFLFQAGYLLFS